MMNYFIRDPNGVVWSATFEEWAVWMDKDPSTSGRQVARTERKEFVVSTIFLGVECGLRTNPSWETMVFMCVGSCGKLGVRADVGSRRSLDERSARESHDDAVRWAEANVVPRYFSAIASRGVELSEDRRVVVSEFHMKRSHEDDYWT